MRRDLISIFLLLALLLLLYSIDNSTSAFGLGSTFLISQSSDGVPGNALSESPSIAEGNVIAFVSEASNLVANDNNGQRDIFLRSGSTTTRVSQVPGTGQDANGASDKPKISDNGAWVVFESYATNLVTQTTDANFKDIFLYRVSTGEIQLVTVTPDGQPANGESQEPYVSNDGRWVVFASFATNLVDPAPTGAQRHIYLRDMVEQSTQVVSLDNNNQFATLNSETPTFTETENGTKFVLFVSLSNLINDDTANTCLSAPGCSEVFIRNISDGTTELISVDSNDLPGVSISEGSKRAVMSADARWVVFESRANFDGDTNGIYDIFVRDRQNGTTKRISVKFNGLPTEAISWFADISPSGEWITFASSDPQLLEGDNNDAEDTFRYHNVTENQQPLKIISVATGGQQGAEASRESSILDSGEQIAFRSFAENLVADDDFSGSDIFLHYLSIQVTPTPTVTGTPPTSTPTLTHTPTVTGTQSTNTPTSTPTVTGTPPTNTPTQTTTITNTPTYAGQVATFTATPTATRTVTGTPPTATPTVTGTLPTVTGTPPTSTPTMTITGTPPTSTPTRTPGSGTGDPHIYLPIIQR